MSKFTTRANDALDGELNNGATGTDVVGSTTYTLPYKAALTTTVSTAAAAGTEFSGGSYAAQSLAGQCATAAASASKSTTGTLTYSNMPAGTWADVYIKSSDATPKNVLFRGGSSLAKTVNAGDTCLINAGNLTATES